MPKDNVPIIRVTPARSTGLVAWIDRVGIVLCLLAVVALVAACVVAFWAPFASGF